MNNIISLGQNQIDKHGILFMAANGVAILCTIIVVFAILIDFVRYHQPKTSKKKINSWVDTGTMFIYFFGYYLLMHIQAGRYIFPSKIWVNVMLIIGTNFVVIGCYVNVKGRFVLKDNWANQVTLYHDQTFVTTSVYAYLRHPLYASLIWMLMGGSIIYNNFFAFLSVLFIFIPMMYYRAKQEENLLSTEFPEYTIYKDQVGLFFPKILKHGKI